MSKVRGTLVAAAVAVGLAACSSGEPGPAGTPIPPSASVPVTQATPSGEPSPSDGAPSIDDVAQDMAATAAQGYLDVMGMSRDALIAQLSAGEGIPEDIATTAVDSLDVDWNEQAVRTAEQYLGEEGMTRDQLLEQLTSSYDQYTQEQAEHAADQVAIG